MSQTTSSNSGCAQTVAIPTTVSPSSLSGYTRLTEFTFTPNLSGDFSDAFHRDISNSKVVWDFGDGYTLSAQTPYEATHRYDYPGTYTVTLFFYDSEGNALLNLLTEQITVVNYFTNQITFAGNVSANFLAGVFSNANELPFFAKVTWQDYVSSGNTVHFAASGADIADIYDEQFRYAHLIPFRSFYDVQGNRVRNIKLDLEPQYYYLDGETPVLTSAGASGAVILGAQGSSSVYYFDDSQGQRRVFAALDTSTHRLPDYYINDNDTNLNLTDLNYQESNLAYIDIESLSAQSTKLVITSTGHSKMPVSSKKRQGDRFQFFAAAGDSSNNIHKYYSEFYYGNSDFDAASTGAFKVVVDDGTTSATTTAVSSLSSSKFPYSQSLSSCTISSFGYFNYTPTLTGTHTIYVSGRAADGLMLSGSHTFTVYPSAGDNIYKINETTFDHAATIKSYRFQNFLNDYDQLFDGVIGTIVGVASSEPTSFGKTLYEKISNFVINNNDIDTCNVRALVDLHELLNEEADFSVNPAPPELRRLIDLYSIRLKRLMGSDERFSRSFDALYSSSSAYGVNIDFNNELSASTYVVSAGTPFVAVQKFNKEHILIQPQKIAGSHTYPASASSVSAYPLSAYNVNSNWGWPLDTGVSGVNLQQLYNFYAYVEGDNGTRVNNILSYDVADHNTLSRSLSTVADWDGDTGTIYTAINAQLRKGLNL